MFQPVTVLYIIFFFFQAEDGIRDGRVTGVQTCALPIFCRMLVSSAWARAHQHSANGQAARQKALRCFAGITLWPGPRSEERRVGKEGRSRWAWDQDKKKRYRAKTAFLITTCKLIMTTSL